VEPFGAAALLVAAVTAGVDFSSADFGAVAVGGAVAICTV